MGFIAQFEEIINDSKVQMEARSLLNEGKKHSPFINYFGINYNQEDIVSVKLYFSFFQMPSDEFFENFGISKDEICMIKDKWEPSKTYDFMHQGLTFGLKCYLKNEEIQINKYLHFRTKDTFQNYPSQIKIDDAETDNFPGICFEYHKDMVEYKKYYYYVSQSNIKMILNDFGLVGKESSKISLIEYTESDFDKKININYKNAEDVNLYLKQMKNYKLDDLNKYIYSQYKLYFFAPGVRYNSSTNAIYYVSKNTYYGEFEEKTLDLLIK